MTNMKGEPIPEDILSSQEEPVSDKKEPTKEQKDTSKPEEKAKEEGSNEFEEKFKNMESELGRLRQELGDERKKVETLSPYKMWYDQNANKPQVPQKKDEKNYDEQFFDSPTKTTQQIIEEYERKRTFYDAYRRAPNVFKQAKAQNPAAFEGVDEQMIYQLMDGSVRNGMHPSVLENPDMWVGAAWIAKGQQTGYQLPNAAPQQGEPPTPSERPTPRRSDEDEEIPSVKGDALTEFLIRKLVSTGITREEALKEVQATRDMEGR